VLVLSAAVLVIVIGSGLLELHDYEHEHEEIFATQQDSEGCYTERNR
jgi:hypothetical protein